LGIDFTMLEQGKSRLIVTTDKRARYELDRKGPKVLNLTLSKTTIPPLLMRQIDATHFAGAVDRVETTVLADAKGVSIDLHLKEMVPFHLKQSDRDISIDFGRTSVKPPEKELVPLQLAEARTPRQAPSTEPLMAEPQVVKGRAAIPGLRPVTYTGSRMTMDFVNADVTNILRLIGEVSNLNIVWGPEVRGNVSMRLKDVPWDQALDLVLANNNLAKRQVGNVIWITTKGQMANIEAEERKKLDEIQKRREKQQRDRVKVEPLETQYITVNFKGASDLQRIIDDTIKSDRGRTTVDQPTKTIIITDTRVKIEEARALVERLDRPTPQVMIEARIVEASQNFARNLGIQWGTGNDWQWREPGSTSWKGTPAWAPQNVPADFSPGASLTAPSFTADTPTTPADFATNIGLTLAKLSSNGLFGWSLDAKIALSEIENESKLLAAPKVMTRDTVTATIQQGTKIVIPAGTDANGNKTFEQQDASLKLEVTPQITPNNMVIMQVHIQQDEPDFDNAIGENIPIKTKSASTMMMVASGETLVIGGIYKSTVADGESRVPGLGSIPGLGWLFKAQRKRIERVELLLFITPTVIPAA
jgi:type IV pilus assembly protein PilQ